jgi:phenylacetate-CoA ligase
MYAWLARNVCFRFQEWVKGHPTFDILKDMRRADTLSAGELKNLQCERLRGLIDYCSAHVPYVRNLLETAGIDPARIRSSADLALLPVMTKADIRRNRDQLRSTIATRLSQFTTGGSTGEPLVFDLSKRRVASRVACRQRVSEWWGVSVGVPELALWGAPVELSKQDWLRQARDRLLATRLLSAFEMNEATMAQYLDILERGNFRQIFGYPSAIYLLCLESRKRGGNLRRRGIEVVFVTGEVLLPFQRDFISETLNCPVANGYGGRDSGFIAHECPQGGMHILSDSVIVEILDAARQPVASGETGEIVVTDLYSHEVPFIRYVTGDMGAISTHPCRCGRSLPLLDRVEGRANDLIFAADGRVINSLALIYSVRELPGIEQFRIVQKSIDRFHVQIVGNNDSRAGDEEHIRRSWMKLLRSSVQVTFEYLPSLPAERSGKFRHVISEIPAGPAPETTATLIHGGSMRRAPEN